MIFGKFKYKLKGPIATKSDLVDFEEFIHKHLPSAFADFLLLFNGCIPSPETDTYHSEVELPGGSDITIHQFYTLAKDASPLRCMCSELEDMIGIVPINSIPIGHDAFGNILCIDLENGLLQWIQCEERFSLDYLRVFDLNVSFESFVCSLKAGPYV